MKKKINMPLYNWIQENYGENSIEFNLIQFNWNFNENINPTKFGGEKYCVQFNLIYEFESNPIQSHFNWI